MEATNNDDKLFLTGLSDLYKLWQNTLAAEEDLNQDKKTLNYLEGFSSDESYGKKALRENHKNLIDRKSKLKNETIETKSKLQEAIEKVKEAKKTFEQGKGSKKFWTIAIFVFAALTVSSFTIGPTIVNSLSAVDLGHDGMIGTDPDKINFYGGVLIVVMILSVIITIVAIKWRLEENSDKYNKEKWNKAEEEEKKITSDLAKAENELEVVEAKILEKTNEYASHLPVLLNSLQTAVTSKTELFNSLVKNLNEFQDSDHRFPKEKDFYKIPMIVDYWDRGYFDNMQDALNFCRDEERQQELINTLNVGFASVCASLNNLNDSVSFGFSQMSAQMAHIDMSIQRQTDIVKEATDSIQELKEINREMASSLESCANDTAQMKQYYAYKTQGTYSNKEIYSRVFR